MRWCSIDPAMKGGLGIAHWKGRDLETYATLRPAKVGECKTAMKKSGGDYDPARAVMSTWFDIAAGVSRPFLYGGWHTAIEVELGGCSAVVVEESFGKSVSTVAKLAHMRGRIQQSAERIGVAYHEVNVEVWRKVIGDEVGLVFPPHKDEIKERVIMLAKQLYNVTCNDNEAESLLIGRWALATWTVRP